MLPTSIESCTCQLRKLGCIIFFRFEMIAIIMDLGFAGLIEQIEARFGRLIANLLLAALTIVILVWAAETIVSLWVSGVTLWDGGSDRALVGLAMITFVLFALVGISLVATFTVFRYLKLRVIQQIEERANETVEQKKKELLTLRDETIDQLNAKGDELIERIRSSSSVR